MVSSSATSRSHRGVMDYSCALCMRTHERAQVLIDIPEA